MKKGNFYITGLLAMMMVCGLILNGCALFSRLFGKAAPEEEAIDVASFTNRAMLQAVSRITDDGMPKTDPIVSPDGTKLLYCETKTVKDTDTGLETTSSDIVMLRNVNSSNSSVLKSPLVTTGNAFTPGWYEDSTRYLYSFYENNNRRIVRSTSAGGGRTNITRNPVGRYDQNPRIIKGVILITTRERDGGMWTIYSMRDSGSEVTRLVEGYDPAWHPTELKFLYVKGSPSAIWEMDMTTMQETQLYERPYSMRRPQYTYDGSHIVFQRRSEQVVTGTQVTTTTTSGKQSRTRTNTAGTERRWQLYLLNVENLQESVLTEGNVDCTYPSLDQYNNLFFISNATGVRANKTEIYKARLNFE